MAGFADRVSDRASFKYRSGSPFKIHVPATRMTNDRSNDNSASIGAAFNQRISLGRHAASDLTEGTRREWLATTGWGDYALGTTSLLATRRYHGLLIGAARAPIGRRMLVPFIDEDVAIGKQRISLATRRWSDGSVDPDGHRAISGFALEDGVPTWTFEAGPARLEKRIVMLRDERAVAVVWTLVDAPEPISLSARVFVEHRGQHQLDPDANWTPQSTVDPASNGARARVVLPKTAKLPDAVTLFAACEGGTLAPAANWWRRHHLAEERARGYDAVGSACHALTLNTSIAPGESRAFVIGLAPEIDKLDVCGTRMLAAESARRRALLARADLLDGAAELQSLCLAADSFVVQRRRKDGAEGRSIIAGFPWFEDWGRDAMIALPGILLATGRADDAKLVLDTFLEHLSDGLLPNRFPDEASEPEFHSADAPLLAINAAYKTWRASQDDAWFARALPALLSIVDNYARGTRHGIGIDQADGLVRAGENGLQLTWMDAKIGDTVVTPRIGKPVELSALWIASLAAIDEAHATGRFAGHVAAAADIAARLAKARASFARFWSADLGCLIDVLDGPAGDERLVRPNQLFALASTAWPLDADTRKRALAKVAAQLATPLAVRTLAPNAPGYRGRYEGDQRSRDFAYHNGTAWPFLAGLRLIAETLHDRDRGAHLARLMVADLSGQLRDGGMGSIGEIADGDSPHEQRGCPMQAWSVGCLLEALVLATKQGTPRA